VPSKKQKGIRVGRTEPCPCESGKKYGACCWKKRFEYHRDKSGTISRVLPLSDEAVEFLKGLRENFRSIFGRYPSGKDKLLPDQYFASPDDLDAAFDAVPGLRPEIVYAARKTDRVVTEDNWNFLTDAEQAEWQEAIDEYFSRAKSGENPDSIYPETPYRRKKRRSHEDVEIQEILRANLYAAICHAGSFLDNAPRRKYEIGPFLQYYFVARTLDTLRTIYRIFNERYTDDVWTLLRVVYESYLRLAFLRKNEIAWKFFMSVAGTQRGTHQYARRQNGKTDYGHIVNSKTGEEVRNFSNREMAKTISALDLDIYERLYPFLSSYSHVSLDPDFQYFTSGEGFHIHKEDDPDMALEFSNIILAAWLSELSQIEHITKKVRRDLSYISKRISNFEVELIRVRPKETMPLLMKLLEDRLGQIGTA
jgi:hypothetical protein